MRTDAVIDQEPVMCKNAQLIGFQKYPACFGDIIVFRENYPGGDFQQFIGRVAGRVHYAPELPSPPPDKPTPEINDFILTVVLSRDATFVMERWVDPKDVSIVYNPLNCGTDVVDLMTFFFGQDFMHETPQDLIAWAGSGCKSMARYREITKSHD